MTAARGRVARDRERWRRIRAALVRLTLIGGLVAAAARWNGWALVMTALGIGLVMVVLVSFQGRRAWRRQLRIAVLVSAYAAACTAVLVCWGWWGLAWLLLVALSAPAAGRLVDLWGWVQDDTAGRLPEGLDEAQTLPRRHQLADLDDEALCLAWRRSYVSLQSGGTQRRAEVVTLRQAYLDELARRHPAAVRRWLASGARAAGNPLPFLQRSPGSGEHPLRAGDDRGVSSPDSEIEEQ